MLAHANANREVGIGAPVFLDFREAINPSDPARFLFIP